MLHIYRGLLTGVTSRAYIRVFIVVAAMDKARSAIRRQLDVKIPAETLWEFEDALGKLKETDAVQKAKRVLYSVNAENCTLAELLAVAYIANEGVMLHLQPSSEGDHHHEGAARKEVAVDDSAARNEEEEVDLDEFEKQLTDAMKEEHI